MHTYRKTREDHGYLYTVGFSQPSETVNDWTSIEDFNNEQDARKLVNFLNGGTGHPSAISHGGKDDTSNVSCSVHSSEP